VKAVTIGIRTLMDYSVWLKDDQHSCSYLYAISSSLFGKHRDGNSHVIISKLQVLLSLNFSLYAGCGGDGVLGLARRVVAARPRGSAAAVVPGDVSSGQGGARSGLLRSGPSAPSSLAWARHHPVTVACCNTLIFIRI
jgi:hypothetical protein